MIYYLSAYFSKRMLSSAGRASPLQGGGRRFDPVSIHQMLRKLRKSNPGRVAKWLNAADCKSVPEGSAVRICPLPPLSVLGCSQAVRQQTLTLSSHWFDPSHPSHHSLAQSVEHLTFNQGVRSSNLRRVTKSCPGGGTGRRTGLKILR